MKKDIEQAHWHQSIGLEFQEAFYILIGKFSVSSESWKERVERPSYFCAGQAIEHFLKGYLSLYELKYDFLRKQHRGHDLKGLLDVGNVNLKKFFELNDEDISEILLLNERYFSSEDYGRFDLRYGTKTGTRISPHPDNLNRIVKKLESKLHYDLIRSSAK